LPIHLENKDAVRLSIVCYLRHRLWEKTRGKSKKFMKKHIATYRRLHDMHGGSDDLANMDVASGEITVGGCMHY
jgi:hypothetical protein